MHREHVRLSTPSGFSVSYFPATHTNRLKCASVLVMHTRRYYSSTVAFHNAEQRCRARRPFCTEAQGGRKWLSTCPLDVQCGRDLRQQWTSWLVQMFMATNFVMFVITMFVNNCPQEQWRTAGQLRCQAPWAAILPAS